MALFSLIEKLFGYSIDNEIIQMPYLVFAQELENRAVLFRELVKIPTQSWVDSDYSMCLCFA